MDRTSGKRVLVVVRHMIHHARAPAMRVSAAQFFRADDLARRRFHQRRPAEENGPLVANDHRFVAHGRHVGAARGARAHDAGDLRNPLRLIRAWLKKMRPKWSRSGKFRPDSGKLAPPRSTR